MPCSNIERQFMIGLHLLNDSTLLKFRSNYQSNSRLKLKKDSAYNIYPAVIEVLRSLENVSSINQLYILHTI